MSDKICNGHLLCRLRHDKGVDQSCQRRSSVGFFLSSVGIDSVASDSDVCVSEEDIGKKPQNNHCCGMRGIPDSIWNQDGRSERLGSHLQSERRSNTENF